MSKITITIETGDDFAPSDLSRYVQTLREQFEEDSAETGHPAWTITEIDVEHLRNERDEARRMWCEAAPVGNSLSVDDMDRRARAEAKRRGWDCFKENT